MRRVPAGPLERFGLPSTGQFQAPALSWLGMDLTACCVGAQPKAEATGYVADLKLAYDKSALAIAPLKRGAGLKFKEPQALAYALPVVTTTVGAEGMPPGCSAIVTDSATERAGAIIGLLQAPEELRRLGEAGRTWATAVFDFSRSMDNVERRFEELLRRP